MNSINRIMVGLDFSLMDKAVIEYTAFLCNRLNPEKIYFVNVQSSLDVPDEIREHYAGFGKPMDEQLREDMMEEIFTYFPDYESYDIELDVIEGSPRKEMLRWTHVKDIELLIVGRKPNLRGSGIVPEQLARKATCSVLFVPEKASPQLEKLWVPTDFSDFSASALKEALKFGQGTPSSTIILQHVYSVPLGYTKTGKSELDFAEVVKRYCQDRCGAFLEPFLQDQGQIETQYTFDHNRHNTAELIIDEAHKQEADMILIGARGRSALTAVFLGSISEKLIKLDFDIPLLVVKQKDKTFSFFEMLEQL